MRRPRRGFVGGAAARVASIPALFLLGVSVPISGGCVAQESDRWEVHSMERPRPAVVDPGPTGPPRPAPGDAVVLFGGQDLSEWRSEDGGPPGWTVEDGVMRVVPGSGNLVTRRAFRDVQLHLEWAAPTPPEGEGQDRGNSGVFLMTLYEIQILDSYGNDTYADGQAAALYGQAPPLVNASRPPGEWQSYDVVFRAPRFGPDGELERPARVTVLHNGVLVHDAVPLEGRTVHGARARYAPHEDRLPLLLQDHDHPVRFRNIWVRELGDGGEEGVGS